MGQKPEAQISFAQESKPHNYYVQQAELWAKELAKDSLSETSWYNYFRSCRNSHGTADWRSDFVDESPYLLEGSKIVNLINQYIPNTFTDYYVSYLTNGIGTSNYEKLLKAYQMNPDFPGIHSSVISYAESSLNTSLRQTTNKTWFSKNYLSSQLLNYGYNLLMSLDTNALLFVQHDNDTYPIWMLQDVLNIRTDVKVISIDFLLLNHYRDSIYRQLSIPEIDLGEVDIDDYHQNWETVVANIINYYAGPRPIYCSMTLFNHLYKKFDNELFVSGLAFRYSKTEIKLSDFNKHLFEQVFRLDYLSYSFLTDRNQMNINYQNANYMSCFKVVYDDYIDKHELAKAEQIKTLALNVARRVDNPKFVSRIETLFKD